MKDCSSLVEIYLPCPRSNRRSVYLHNNQGQLYEVQKITGPGRKASFLIDSYIYRDGAVRFITRMDPLFMALPILDNAYKRDSTKFDVLDTLLSRENVSIEVVDTDEEDEMCEMDTDPIDVHRLTTLSGFTEQLANICDRKVAPNLYAYKLNPQLVLTWLSKKVERVVSNPSFQASFAATEQDQQWIKLEAVYMIANYLNKEWFNKLLEHLNLSEQEEKVEELLTNYATNASPAAFFKRAHPEEMAALASIPKVSV
ncbi:ribonuclease H2, subunit B [Choanephora cucurbitarum]|nr:ribonuclease H2, subunit B [Choanephora cucurbitarum]